MRLYIALLALFVSMLSLSIYSQDFCKEQKSFVELLEKQHISPKPLNDTWSEDVFHQVIDYFDYDRMIFLDEDINTLSKYRKTLDDDFPENSCLFFEELCDIYQKRMQESISYLQEINGKNISFSTEEFYTYSQSDSLLFADNTADLKKRLLQWVKLQALEMVTEQEDMLAINTDSLKKAFSMQKDSIISDLLLDLEEEYTYILDHPRGFKKYALSDYFIAIAEYYDPHSTYMLADEQEEYMIDVSDSYYSFGISLEKGKNNALIIDYLVPGSQAWKSNKLNKGDEIIKIQFDNGETFTAETFGKFDSNKLLQAASAQQITVTVKKASNAQVSVKLKSELTENDENIIRSYVFKGEKTIGYIYLPGFYTDLDEESQLGCANDLAKEILKLKQEGIQGLVLDLRNNGGGSVQEAIGIAGIFINFGAMLIYEDEFKQLQTLKDMNRGMIYTDPLSIIVNEGSASASELLAAILQDYNRALIVGSRTFGKSTGQLMYPVQSSSNTKADEIDYAKITCARFFRVNGTSFQGKGITPDIAIPNIFSAFYDKESDFFYSLKATTVSKKTYYYPLEKINSDTLQQLSAKRMATEQQFIQLSEKVKQLETEYFAQEKQVSLQLDEFINTKKSIAVQIDAIIKLMKKESSPFKAVSTSFDNSYLQMNDEIKSGNEKQLQSLSTNMYLHEVYKIMLDYIGME